MKIKFLNIFLILKFLIFSSSNLFAQNFYNEKFEVEDIEFEIDGERSSLEYRQVFNTHISPIGIITFLNTKIYSKIGSPPEYFDPVIFKEDIYRLKRYLLDKGYFYSIVDTAINYDFKNKNVSLLVKILEGKRTQIDSVTFIGIDSLNDEIKFELIDKSLIKQKSFFDKTLIENERKRILNLFFNSGYRFAVVDSIIVTRFASGKSLFVKILISTEKQYKFGNITINNENPEIDLKIINRQLEFKTGEIYEENKKIESENNLNQLGVFQNAQISFDNTIEYDSIPLIINLRSMSLRDIEPEIIMNDEFSVLNAGVGVGYFDRNFFKNAEKFSTNVRFLVHSIQELDLNSVSKNGIKDPSFLTKTNLNLNFIQPYFFSNKTTFNFSLNAEYEKQKIYNLNTFRVKTGTATKLATYTLGFIDLYAERINIENYSPEIDITSLIGNRKIQLNTFSIFTIQRDKTNNLFSPTSGFFTQFSFEESGFIVKNLKGFSQNLPYSEYYKFNFNHRHYFDLSNSESTIFAVRFRGGNIVQYNKSNQTPVPPTRKFYLGGSSSMRSWRARSLATFSQPDFGGNTSLEFSAELRQHFAKKKEKLEGLEVTKFWSAMFVDFGNLWNNIIDVKYNQIAISGGFGLRYETMVGPIRLDYAWRIYDPSEQNRKWIFDRKFFKESYGLVQLGIGHAF